MRRRLFAPFIALATFCLVTLAACGGPSAEDLIREDITAQLEEVKAGDADFLAGIEEDAGEDFDLLGVDTDAFMQAYLDGFAYEVGTIAVEDATATADVEITIKPMTQVLTTFQDNLTTKLGDLSWEDVTDQTMVYRLGGEALMEAVNATEPQAVSCTITYEQDDEGAWEESEDTETQVTNALMGTAA